MSPPFGAREVVAMSRTTDAGEVTATRLCALFGISRQAYYAARKSPSEPARRATPPARSAVPGHELLRRIREVLARHPSWGHRKVWATLRRGGVLVGRRRVAETMKAHGEMLEAHAPQPRERRRGHVVVAAPNRRFATDLTTVMTKRSGLVAVVLTVDCGCRSVLDVTATKSQESGPVLASVERALVDAFGAPEKVPVGFELRSDHGSQYTGKDAEKLSKTWGYEHTFAPVGRPTGNAVAERTIQTMKVECVWLEEFEDVAAVQVALDRWRSEFNDERPHQSLHWRTPSEVRAAHLGTASRMAA